MVEIEHLPRLDDVPGGPDGLRTTLGANAMHNLDQRGFLERATRPPNIPAELLDKRPRSDRKPRTYVSRFVGVTICRSRYLAQWGPKNATRSSVFPLTDAGEIQAAQARATALGRDYLEMRPPEQVRGTPEAAQAVEARGPGQRKMTGRRIG